MPVQLVTNRQSDLPHAHTHIHKHTFLHLIISTQSSFVDRFIYLQVKCLLEVSIISFPLSLSDHFTFYLYLSRGTMSLSLFQILANALSLSLSHSDSLRPSSSPLTFFFNVFLKLRPPSITQNAHIAHHTHFPISVSRSLSHTSSTTHKTRYHLSYSISPQLETRTFPSLSQSLFNLTLSPTTISLSHAHAHTHTRTHAHTHTRTHAHSSTLSGTHLHSFVVTNTP